MTTYSLHTILSTITKKNGKKRLLYNFGPVGGWNSSIIATMFWSIPFIMFAALFNPSSFAYLGIAQSIIFYIVFSSMAIILVTGMIFAFNANLIRKVEESWQIHFPGRDLTLIVSSGITPYSTFFEKYSLIAEKNLSEKETKKAILNALNTMEEENKELLEVMKRNT